MDETGSLIGGSFAIINSGFQEDNLERSKFGRFLLFPLEKCSLAFFNIGFKNLFL